MPNSIAMDEIDELPETVALFGPAGGDTQSVVEAIIAIAIYSGEGG